MDLNKDRPAVEIPFLFYSLALAGVWFLRAPQNSVTPFMVFLHIGLAFLLWRTVMTPVGSRVPTRIMRRLFPYLMWALAWSEIGWLYSLTQPLVHDGGVRALDQALFGAHLNEGLSVFLPWEGLRNLMGFSYLSYYLLILGPPLVLAFRRRERELDHYTMGLMSTYLACFLIYIVMPVLGPRELAQASGEISAGVGGLFGPVIQAFFENGDSPGTAFPSSHCAGSVAAALLVHRNFGRASGRLALIWAGLIVISTVYTNNHYAIDAVAGVAVAILIQKVAVPAFSHLRERKFLARPGFPETGLNLTRQSDSVKKGGLS